MKVTIIPIDGNVKKDGEGLTHLDLSSCNIPNDVHALQWQGTSGWIEYTSAKIQNESITELPIWANACLNKLQEALDSIMLEHNSAQNLSNLSNEQKLTILVVERNARLAATDWTQIPDVVAVRGVEWANKWAVYRQTLRDLPANTVDLNNVLYPVPPQV